MEIAMRYRFDDEGMMQRRGTIALTYLCYTVPEHRTSAHLYEYLSTEYC